MAPPQDGNEYLPFGDMIALEKINESTYRSIAMPFSPGGTGRAYGGHVYAQAVWAAAQTVPEGFIVHNVTGWFILAGLTNVPFVYNVKTIRDGRSYSTRIVNVTQAEGKGICFTATCSFKTAEDGPLDVQDTVDIWDKYAAVLKGTKEEDWEEAPGMDVPWYWRHRAKTGHNDPFPGLESLKPNMDAYNASLPALDKRQLLFYRILGTLPHSPTSSSNANLHACAHLYASDRNSLFVVANHLSVGDAFTAMGSLSHTVVFHTPRLDALMTDAAGQRVWFVKEDWTTRAAGGRGIHCSRMVGPGGVHVASSWQEGMVRIGKRPGDGARAAERREKVAMAAEKSGGPAVPAKL